MAALCVICVILLCYLEDPGIRVPRRIDMCSQRFGRKSHELLNTQHTLAILTKSPSEIRILINSSLGLSLLWLVILIMRVNKKKTLKFRERLKIFRRTLAIISQVFTSKQITLCHCNFPMNRSGYELVGHLKWSAHGLAGSWHLHTVWKFQNNASRRAMHSKSLSLCAR